MSKKAAVTKEETQNTPAVQEAKPLVTAAHAAAQIAAWDAPTLERRDFVIPKVLAMQAMSKLVTDGQARLGEFRDSLNSTVLGGVDKPLEFVPLYMQKNWVEFEERQGAMKFARSVPIIPSNENLPLEDMVDGKKIRRDRTMDFYVLFPKDIADGCAIPYLLSFRRSSALAGKKLATTMFMRNLKAGKTPASMVMELIGTKTSNDKGTFIVLDVKEKRPSTDREVAECFSWVNPLKSGSHQVDNSDLDQDPIARPELEVPSESGPSQY